MTKQRYRQIADSIALAILDDSIKRHAAQGYGPMGPGLRKILETLGAECEEYLAYSFSVAAARITSYESLRFYLQQILMSLDLPDGSENETFRELRAEAWLAVRRAKVTVHQDVESADLAHAQAPGDVSVQS